MSNTPKNARTHTRSLRVEFQTYDQFPKRIKTALQEAALDWDCVSLLEAWKQAQEQGWSEMHFVKLIRTRDNEEYQRLIAQ